MPQMTARQVLASIYHEPDNTNARYVQLIGLKSYSGSVLTETLTSIPGQETRKHRQLFYCVDPNYTGKISDCSGLKCACSCPRWLYVWEYAAAQAGMADILFGNGQPAVQTNPSGLVSTCKHLNVVLRQLMRQAVRID